MAGITRAEKQRRAAEAAALEAERAAAVDPFDDLLLPEGDEEDDEADAPGPGALQLAAPRIYRTRKYPCTPEVCTEILERLSAGELLKDICSEARRDADPEWPPAYIVYTWRKAEPEGFGAEFAAAMRSCLDRMGEQLIEIATDEARDFKINEKGRIVFNGHAVRRAEVIINTKKWLMSKLAPDIYGDRLEVRAPPGEGLDKVSTDDLAAQLLALVGPEGAAALGASLAGDTIEGTSRPLAPGEDDDR